MRKGLDSRDCNFDCASKRQLLGRGLDCFQLAALQQIDCTAADRPNRLDRSENANFWSVVSVMTEEVKADEAVAAAERDVRSTAIAVSTVVELLDAGRKMGLDDLVEVCLEFV